MIERTMVLRLPVALGFAASLALACASCGIVGLELAAIPQLPGADAAADAEGPGRDAQQTPPEDAATEAGPGADARTADASAPDAGPVACDLAGTWAVKLTAAVSWPAGVLAAGSGTASLWFKFQGTQMASTLPGTLQTCGLVWPDFSLQPAVGTESYRLRFADALFDAMPARIAALPSTFAIAGTGLPGDALSLAPSALVVGASLTDPRNDAWPANATALPDLDHDADGLRGVSVSCVSGGGFSYPRSNPTGTQRVDRAYAALRVAFSMAGSIASCSELSGSSTLTRYDTHMVGCHVAGGAECTTTERDTLDGSRPVYTPGAASYRAIKVPANADCAAVRAALP